VTRFRDVEEDEEEGEQGNQADTVQPSTPTDENVNVETET